MIRRPRVLILFQFYVVEIFRISYGRISSAMINATDERGFAGWNWGHFAFLNFHTFQEIRENFQSPTIEMHLKLRNIYSYIILYQLRLLSERK